jgi:FkbM family methyltransferase
MNKILYWIIKKIIFFIDILIHRKKLKKKLINLNLKINTIFDVGSNNGDYTMLFNQIYPKAKIFSFEPNPYLCKIAKQKAKKKMNIKIIECAAGNKNLHRRIKIDLSSPLTNSLAPKNTDSYNYKIKKILNSEPNFKLVKIKIIKLDDFISKNKTPDFIKIDVEGFEHKVLKGLKKNLKKIKLIMIEFHFDKLYKNYNFSRLHKTLIQNNFEHISSIKFPLLAWEDRLYLNKK